MYIHMPRKSRPKRKPAKNVRYNKRKSRRYNTSDMIISRPLLPETQKVMLKYYTRIQIDPMAVKSGSSQTANSMAKHTFAFNDPYDIDKTHTLSQTVGGTTTGRLQDGAPDHQPLMYDQYRAFYENITVIGAKVKASFSQVGRITVPDVQEVRGPVSHTHPQGQVLETINGTKTLEPLPCYVGFANSQHYDEAVFSTRFDDAREKNTLRYRKLQDADKSQTLVAKWSMTKDQVYKSQLPLHTSHEAPENFSAAFDHSPTNLRFCHLFAHPMTLQNALDPAPIDVEVEISQICLLSGRRDIAQS